MLKKLFNKVEQQDEEKICLTKSTNEDDTDDEADGGRLDDHRINGNIPKQDNEDNETVEEGQSSNLQTSFHILNLIQGMGTLGIPYAIKVGGLSSIIYIVVIALVTCYTSGLIIEAQYDERSDVSKEPEETQRVKSRHGYAAVGDAVWKSYGSKLVCTVQLIHLFGACVLYLILVSNFFQGLFPKVLLSEFHCTLLAGFLVFPTAFLSNLSNIAWLSLTSIASLNIVFACLILYSALEIREWSISTLPIASVDGTAISICIILFSYVAHPYLPKIEANMKNPKQFKYVTNVAFTVATMTKIVFGVFLACHYGKNTHQRVTNNITNRNFKLTVDALLALSGLFSFAMPLNVILNIVQRSNTNLCAGLFTICSKKDSISWSERGIDLTARIALVCLSTSVAMLIPEFSLLMAIFGSVTAVCLVIIFPICFFSKLFKDSVSVSQSILNTLIVAILSLVGATGLVYSLKALIMAMKNSET